jgi:hypothetical protein
MEKIILSGFVRNEEVLHRVKGEGNMLHTIQRRKATWIAHSLLRNSVLYTILKER